MKLVLKIKSDSNKTEASITAADESSMENKTGNKNDEKQAGDKDSLGDDMKGFMVDVPLVQWVINNACSIN